MLSPMASDFRAPLQNFVSLLIWAGCLWLAWAAQKNHSPAPAGALTPPLPGIHSPSQPVFCTRCHRPCLNPPQAHRPPERTAQ